jgi:biopolymer transport protein TolR
MDAGRRSRFRSMSQINVVPYIDVMLVLLVIFMVTTPMMKSSVVELPQVSQATDAPAQPIEITVTPGGQLLLRDPLAGGSPAAVADADLVRVLKERLAATPERPVVIAADRRTEYGTVMRVMDVLQREKVARVGLLTRPPGGN